MNKNEITNLINNFQKLENYQHMKQYQKLISILNEFNYLEKQINFFNINNSNLNIKIYLFHSSLNLVFDNLYVDYDIFNNNFNIHQTISNNLKYIVTNLNLFENFVDIHKEYLEKYLKNYKVFNSIKASFISNINKEKYQKVSFHRKYLKDIVVNFKKSYLLDINQPILRIELRFYKHNNQFSFLVSDLFLHDKKKYTQEIENYLKNPSNILINGEYHNNSLDDIKQIIPFMNSLPLTNQDNAFNVDIDLLDDFISTSNKLSNF